MVTDESCSCARAAGVEGVGVQIPDYYLLRPVTQLPPDVDDFERLFAEQVKPGTGGAIRYELAAPKWQFLCWMTEFQDVVLHGGNGSTIGTLEPRKADDIGDFGARKAVYAASDGLWPMYFAIADRTVVTSLVNACIQLDDNGADGSYYYFSINQDALTAGPWVTGSVYVLPRVTFEPEPEETWQGMHCAPTQWASSASVRPMARLTVTPDDFPFLHQVRSHDPQVVSERAARDPDDFPWLDGP
jgi:hypothetical protein